MFVTLDLISAGRQRRPSVKTIQEKMERFLQLRISNASTFTGCLKLSRLLRPQWLIPDTETIRIYSISVSPNHALVTIKVEVGDSPPWSPQSLYAAEDFVSHQTDFFNSR